MGDGSAAALAPAAREARVVLDGIHCASCVARAEQLLAPLASDVHVSLVDRTASFTLPAGPDTLPAVLSTLERAGLSPRLLGPETPESRSARRLELARIGIAVFGAMQVMMLAWPDYQGAALEPSLATLLRYAQWLLATPVVLWAGWPFLRNAARSLEERTLSMDVPVAASLLIAYGASSLRTFLGEGELYFDAATMFVMLLSGGRYLEGRTREHAADRLRVLAARQSVTALRVTLGGNVESVPIAQLMPGDTVRVPPGEALPADGVLDADFGDFDESLLTGEPRPLRRARGEPVIGGSLNAGLSTVQVRCTMVGAASRLGEIRRILARAAAERPRFQQLADRVAAYFVFAILALAALGAAAWWPAGHERALAVALAVLVSSCPCALSLAMPAVLAAASARLAARGVLLAHPAALERMAGIDLALFDKTGTLTEDGLSIARTHVFGPLSAAESIALGARLETGLRHPVARAFGVAALPAERVTILPGGGVRGSCDGHEYSIAPPRPGELPATAQALVDREDDAAMTWLCLREGSLTIALFGLRAAMRPCVPAVVAALRGEGVGCEMLTGDAQSPARDVARAGGIAKFRWGCRPDDKLRRVQQLQSLGHRVMAVGDGINDAPYLAAADVSVAMPAGAALAQANADVILAGGSLEGLVELRRVAVAARRRIRENIAWALGYNLVMLPLALSGTLAPWMAALGMSASSLVVVANALRVDPR